MPIRWYHGTFTATGRTLRLPTARGCPPLLVRLDRHVPYPPGTVRRAIRAEHRLPGRHQTPPPRRRRPRPGQGAARVTPPAQNPPPGSGCIWSTNAAPRRPAPPASSTSLSRPAGECPAGTASSPGTVISPRRSPSPPAPRAAHPPPPPIPRVRWSRTAEPDDTCPESPRHGVTPDADHPGQRRQGPLAGGGPPHHPGRGVARPHPWTRIHDTTGPHPVNVRGHRTRRGSGRSRATSARAPRTPRPPRPAGRGCPAR